MRDYWHKQTPDKPLFPDLLWSRPENKRQAGKLLIVGGNAHGFAAPAEAFAAAERTGVGTVRVALPDSLQKTVGQSFAAGEFAPSTPSGSFSQQALADLLDGAKWADAVLLAGDFGHNSETAVLLEKFMQDHEGLLVLSQDAIDYFASVSTPILNRPDTLLVTEFAQLQKLAKSGRFAPTFTSDMDLLHLIDGLHGFTERFSASVMIECSDNTIIAAGGQVSTTKTSPPSLISAAAGAAVWWLQNPDKPFEALATAALTDQGGLDLQ